MLGRAGSQLWERGRALDAMSGVVDAARRREGSSLFIEGEPGLGKTSLLERLRTMVGGDVRVGRGRGDEMEQGMAFGLVSQAMETLGARHPLEPFPQATGPDARAAQFYRILRWLEAADAPVLLAFDDLHWADQDTLALVRFLCRRLRGLPVGLIATLRPWPTAAADLCASLSASGDARVELLSALSPAACDELLEARVGASVDEATAREARDLCSGNPLLIEQLAVFIQRGEGTTAALDRAAAGTAGVVIARFGCLPAAAMRCLQAASVLGDRFSPELAARVAQLEAGERDEAFAAMWRSGLTRRAAEGEVEFVHPLFRQVVYEDLGEPLQACLHDRAFVVLLEQGAEREAAEQAVRGHLAGRPEAVEVLASAGRRAFRSGALAVAPTYLGAAVSCAGVRASPQLLMDLAEALLATGRFPEGIETCRRIVRDCPEAPGRLRVDALRALGRALSLSGQPEEGMLSFAEAAEVCREADSASAVEVLLDQALVLWMCSGPAAALPLTVEARRLAEAAGDPALRRRADVAWGFTAIQCGDLTGADSARAAAAHLLADPLSDVVDLSRTWGVLSTSSKASILVEDFAGSERMAQALLSAAEEVGAPEAIASEAASHSYTLLRTGRPAEALELLDRAANLVELFPPLANWVGCGHAMVLHALGRTTESERWCDEVQPVAEATGEWLTLMTVWRTRGERLLRTGCVAEARELFLRVEDLSRRMGIDEPCVSPWQRHAIAAHVACGAVADAERIVGWLEACSARLPCRWPRIAAATGRGFLAESRGDGAGAEKHLGEALQLHGEVPLLLEEAETHLELGRMLRRRGDVVRSRQPLAEALSIAERCGGGWLARLAHEELLVAGGRRRRARTGDDPLTPQEQRVAELAASGLGNRQIARQLFLSVSTIESHMRRIYSKLGLDSRRDLESRRGQFRSGQESCQESGQESGEE